MYILLHLHVTDNLNLNISVKTDKKHGLNKYKQQMYNIWNANIIFINTIKLAGMKYGTSQEIH